MPACRARDDEVGDLGGDSFGAVWEHQDAAAGSLALDAGADGALKVMTTKAMDGAQLHAGGWRGGNFSFDVKRDGYDLLDASAAGGQPLCFIRTTGGRWGAMRLW